MDGGRWLFCNYLLYVKVRQCCGNNEIGVEARVNVETGKDKTFVVVIGRATVFKFPNVILVLEFMPLF